ncbi:MAG TPA: hypothetical protein VHV09_19485 [Trebonia sp.]|nr:hypothetical protein [Trebonia sp.]
MPAGAAVRRLQVTPPSVVASSWPPGTEVRAVPEAAAAAADPADPAGWPATA